MFDVLSSMSEYRALIGPPHCFAGRAWMDTRLCMQHDMGKKTVGANREQVNLFSIVFASELKSQRIKVSRLFNCLIGSWSGVSSPRPARKNVKQG